MQFEVREDPLWLRRKHTVLVNGQLAFKATSTYFRFFRRIEVADATGRTVMSIQRKLSFLRATYEFVTGGRQTFQFRTQSLWRAVYTVKAGDGLLTVYGHRGRNHSIYRGDAQVGYFTKNMMSHRYLGMADDDQNAALLASIVITLDDYWWRDSDALITFDAGSIGPQAKRFDPAWRPKPEPSTATQAVAADRVG